MQIVHKLAEAFCSASGGAATSCFRMVPSKSLMSNGDKPVRSSRANCRMDQLCAKWLVIYVMCWKALHAKPRCSHDQDGEKLLQSCFTVRLPPHKYVVYLGRLPLRSISVLVLVVPKTFDFVAAGLHINNFSSSRKQKRKTKNKRILGIVSTRSKNC